MKESRDCKIARDLMPSYIENLVDRETRVYVEEHCKECEECKKILEEMQIEMEIDGPKKDNREIKYMKKFKNKLRMLRYIILLIIITVVITFISITGRKMIIIKKLCDKADKYVNSQNYHMVIRTYTNEGYTKDEVFILGDRIKAVYASVTNEGIEESIFIGEKDFELSGDGNIQYKTIEYIKLKNGKKAVLHNVGLGYPKRIDLQLKTEDTIDLLKNSIKSSIKTDKVYNKDCYYITNFKNFGKEGVYVDKETGLVIRYGKTENTEIIETIYEFDTVTEKDFIEPDTNGYEEFYTPQEYYEWYKEQDDK